MSGEVEDESDEPEPPEVAFCYNNVNTGITTPYTYIPLSADTSSQIRLLILLPGLPDADIQCCLQVTELNDIEEGPPDFEALSYVWGDVENTTPIQVDNAILHIGRNLRSALLHLRDEEQPRTLWVDAACINQKDLDERSTQVPLMGDIYTKATRAIAWLGCPCCLLADVKPGIIWDRRDHLRDNLRKINDLFTALHLLDEEAGLVADEGLQVIPKTGGCYEAIWRMDLPWDAILSDNPWWTRAWTLQEIVLARDAVLCMSNQEVAWDAFCRSIAHYKALGLPNFSGTWFGSKTNSGLEPLDMVIAMKEARETELFGHQDIGDELLYYLASCHWRDSSKPHDKIYAVLGMFDKDRQVGINVDYRATPADVFRTATKALLEQSGNLDVLGFCYPFKVPCPGVTGLPSWVPDWGSTGNLAAPLMNDAKGNPRTTHASRGLRSAPRWEDDDTTLVLQGHVVDTVAKVGSVKAATLMDDQNEGSLDMLFKDPALLAFEESCPMTYEDLDPDRPIRDLFSWHRNKSKVGAPAFNKFPSAMVADVISRQELHIEWQDMVASEFQGTSGPGPDDIFRDVLSTCTPCPSGPAENQRHFEEWIKELVFVRKLKGSKIHRISSTMFKTLAIGGGIWNTADGDDDSFASYTLHTVRRRLGITQSGRVCLLPSRAEVGDKIAVLRGGRVPVVLRARGGEGSRAFVGEAFVHGIMDGEVFDEEKCVDVRIT
ncbi:heterokaryon incompatibility protein-domain-containing protein [Podospora conica]|nr:heterokaryon incompatibility protein-domain-containing protein [Schizothecium conicum]